MILQGSKSLSAGATNASVSFSASFPATPDIIHAWIENLTDDPLTAVEVVVVDKDNLGFAVSLYPATPSANYVLKWFAGNPGDIFNVLHYGRTMMEHPLFSGDLQDNDSVLVTTVYPEPRTVRVRVSRIKQLFPNLNTNPSAPTSPGKYGDIAITPAYIYTHDGTKWGRTARTTTW